MFNIKFSHLFLLLAVVFSTSSCKKYFGDINQNPNDPAVVTPDVILPMIQTRLSYTYWGDYSRYASIFTQHVDGVSRQFAVIQQYGLKGSDMDNMWASLYSGVLTDVNQLKTLAQNEGYNHYEGVALALEAYTMLMLTDAFGDVPYAEAFQGTDNLAPAFDSQESIYTAIMANLTEAETKLSAAGEGKTPGADDLIYGGDAAQWVKFVNMVKARANLHLAKRDASKYSDVLTALAAGFGSSADNAYLPYEATANGAAPWYQYIEQRADIAEGANYSALLSNLSDPRATFFDHDLTDVGHPYFTQNRMAPFITYTEAKFMEAEALLNTSAAAADIHTAYLDAISSSFDDLGLSADYATYVGQASVDPGEGNITMDEVMTQKYVAMYTDPEVFNDWRRTGIPALTPNTGSEVPRRLPYSENELVFNTSASSYLTLTIFDRVWWDVN